jgi:uncharacterized membrane protein YeaQ/YmgE (transglycosylase-associated protein family)
LSQTGHLRDRDRNIQPLPAFHNRIDAIYHMEGNIMALESLLIWLVIGAVAGWLAGVIVKGYGFGLVGNIIIGILGSVIGGWLFGNVITGMPGGMGGAILGATIGAIVLLLVIRVINRAT